MLFVTYIIYDGCGICAILFTMQCKIHLTFTLSAISLSLAECWGHWLMSTVHDQKQFSANSAFSQPELLVHVQRSLFVLILSLLCFFLSSSVAASPVAVAARPRQVLSAGLLTAATVFSPPNTLYLFANPSGKHSTHSVCFW